MDTPIKIITNGTRRLVPADEPVFLLRGQDRYAADTVRVWASMVEANGGDAETVRTAREHADKMDAWPTKKMPDLPKTKSEFVQVPETTLPNGLVVPAFMASRYLCTVIDGKAVSSEFETPTVEINYHDANAACEAAGGKLIRETQALTLAWNIYNVDGNWSGGKVGEGTLAQGLHADTVDGPQCNDFEPDPDHPEECRIFMLSNGEIIYDAAGHLFTWVFDDVQGDEHGVVKGDITADSISLSTCPHPSMKKGTGWRPDAPARWSGLALVRGGCWCSGGNAGVFNLGYDWPGVDYGSVGFRCTK